MIDAASGLPADARTLLKDWRGRGIAARGLDETATDANIAFYTKRGFEIIGQGECLGQTLTGMVRRPR